MELFLQANAVADGRKVAVFLTLIGPKTYGLLRNLVAPEKPSEKTLEVVQRGSEKECKETVRANAKRVRNRS